MVPNHQNTIFVQHGDKNQDDIHMPDSDDQRHQCCHQPHLVEELKPLHGMGRHTLNHGPIENTQSSSNAEGLKNQTGDLAKGSSFSRQLTPEELGSSSVEFNCRGSSLLQSPASV
uniref:Uncharacterized protein n=1 Tax=Solanum lycopersicum TaxID=4081 RepID=A0A3Q7FPB9_SOLLC